MEDVFKVCANCEKEISEKNFPIHSAYCERKIQICCLCNEPVQRDVMKEHLEDSHSVAPCKLCNISMEKWELEKHEVECPKKLVLCKYCEMEFASDGLDEHVKHCGSRTEFCSTCKQYIMLKDMEEHPEVCIQLCAPAGGIRSFNNEKWSDNLTQDICYSLTQDICHREKNFLAFFDQPADFAECPICHSIIPLTKMKTHVSKCTNSNSKCSLCGKCIPNNELKAHVLTKCPVLHPHYSDSEGNGAQSSAVYKGVISNHKEENNSIAKTRTKESTFCGKNFSEEEISNHVKSHSEDTFICLGCLEMVPEIERKNHETLLCKMAYEGDDEIPDSKLSIVQGHVPNCDITAHHKEISLPNSASKISATLEKKVDDYAKHNMSTENIIGACAADTKTSPNDPPTHLGKCYICCKFIPWIDMNTHIPTCASANNRCSCCGDEVSSNNLKDHLLKYCPALQKDKSDSDQVLSGNNNTTYCTNNLISEKIIRQNTFFQRHFPNNEVLDHIQSCRENTYKCLLCLEHVPEVDKLEHEKTFCKVLQEDDERPSFRNLPSYADVCKEEDPPKYSSVFSNQKELEFSSMTCPTCHSRIPETRFQNHLKHCKKNMTLCRFCHEEIPKHSIKDHLKECVQNSKSRLEYDPEESGTTNSSGKFQAISMGPNRGDISEKMMPKAEQCPYCDSSCTSLYDHLSDCQGLAMCIFCNTRVFPKNFKQHIDVACKKYARKSEWKTGKKKRKGANKPDNFHLKPPPIGSGGLMSFFRALLPDPKRQQQDKHEEVVMLPCEFCDKTFSVETLIEHQSGCRPDLVHFPPSHRENSKKETKEESNVKITVKQEAPVTNSALSVYANNTPMESINFKAIGSERAQRRLRRNEETIFAPGEFLEYNCWKNGMEIREGNNARSNSDQMMNFNAFLDDKPNKLQMLPERLHVNTEKAPVSETEESIQMNLNTRSIRSIWNSDTKNIDDIDEDMLSNPEFFSPELLSDPLINAHAKDINVRNVNDDIYENATISSDMKEMSASDFENTDDMNIFLRILNKDNTNECNLGSKSNQYAGQGENEYREIFTPPSNLFKNPVCEVCGRNEACMCNANGTSFDRNVNLMPKDCNSKGARPKQTLSQNTGDSSFEHVDVTKEQKFLKELSDRKEISAEFHSYRGCEVKNSAISGEIHQNTWNTWRERKSSECE